MMINRRCERCKRFRPKDYYITKIKNSVRCVECRIEQYDWVSRCIKKGQKAMFEKGAIQTTIPMYFRKL